MAAAPDALLTLSMLPKWQRLQRAVRHKNASLAQPPETSLAPLSCPRSQRKLR